MPQAWQALWQAESKAMGKHLWYPNTVTLCPTGHRNVHFWLVEYMKGGSGESIPQVSRPTTEQAIALDGMTEFKYAGGSLAFLREQHAYGYA